MKNRQSTTLANDLLSKTTNTRARKFIKEFILWQEFFNRILKNPENRGLPFFHSLILNIESVVLAGFAEEWEIIGKDKEKFSNFLAVLNIEEKFLFSLIFEIKPINQKISDAFQEYIISDNQKILDKIFVMQEKDDKSKEERIEKILQSFIKNDIEILEAVFKDRIDLLYGIRCKIVHTGSPVIGTMLLSSGAPALHYGEKDNKFFTIKYDLGEFFIRALYRKTGHEPVPINPQIKSFITENFSARHAQSIGEVWRKL